MVCANNLSLYGIGAHQNGSIIEGCLSKCPRSDNCLQINLPDGPPPPKPKRAKPQAAVTRSTVEERYDGIPDENLLTNSSDQDLDNSRRKDMTKSLNQRMKSASRLMRRHSDIYIPSSMIPDLQSRSNHFTWGTLSNQVKYKKSSSDTSLTSASSIPCRYFDRSCPTRRARRLKVLQDKTFGRRCSTVSSIDSNNNTKSFNCDRNN